jgi:ariadne-1
MVDNWDEDFEEDQQSDHDWEMAEERRPYSIITQQDARQTLQAFINDYKSLLQIPEDEVIIVARHYKWNGDRMQEWLERTKAMEQELGLRPKVVQIGSSQKECEICCTQVVEFGLQCGHSFCKECWREHLNTAVCDKLNGCEATCC